MLVWLLGALLGCSDRATVGGLCGEDCSARDAAAHACSGAGCESADAAADACDADGCAPDAGLVCQAGMHELVRMRTDLLLVVDDSASLAPWWPALNDGLREFLERTSPDGLGVGLQRFDEVCDVAPHAVPAIPIAPLRQNLPALMQAFPFEGGVSTSTLPALQGALAHARSWAAANPDSRVSVVLLTDASPGACDGLAGDYDAESERSTRAAREAVPAVDTYIVAFSTLKTPDAIARGSGTEPLHIGVTPADGEVWSALERVRRSAQPCAFRWPSGFSLAPDSEILATASDGSERHYPMLSSSSACAQQDGFYVEDPSSPYPLLACPRTCETLDAAALSSACSTR